MDDVSNSPLSTVLSSLQALVSVSGGASSSSPSSLPDALLSDLHSLLRTPNGPSTLVSNLPSFDLSLSALLRCLAISIDSGSLQASFVYLSLLLAPSAPVVSLFSPLHFLSLLRSLRRSLKNPVSSSSEKDVQKPKGRGKSKSKPNSKFAQNEQRNDAMDLIPQILGLLSSLITRIQLESYNDIRKGLIDTITEILDSHHHNTLSNMCFRILSIIISEPGHGNQGESTVETLRSLAPLMLLPLKSPVRVGVIGFVVNKIAPLSNENEGVKNALVFLPRFLATKSPEKAEYRAIAVETILEISRLFTTDDFVSFVHYTVKLAKGKPKLRLLSVDLILGLLNFSKNDENETDTSWRAICLKVLIERCSDTVGGIRARALSNVAQVFAEMSERRDEVELERFSEMVKRRCVDDKAAVRKSALLLITKALSLIGAQIDESLLSILGSACSDPLVSIRKAALSAISEVFRRFPDSKVTKEWLQAVPPLIVDNETSIQEECETLFLDLVLNRICQASNPNPNPVTDPTNSDPNPLFPDLLLDLLKGISHGEISPFVKKILASLGKKKKIRPLIANSVQNVITASGSVRAAPQGAWWLLAEVSVHTPKAVDWGFLSHHWRLLDDVWRREREEEREDEGEGVLWARDRVSLLNTISNVSMELPTQPAAELAHSLLSRIEQFNMHLSEVDAHVKSLKTLCKRKAKSPNEGHALVLKWAENLIAKAVDSVNSYLSEASELRNKNKHVTPLSGKKKKEKLEVSSQLVQAVTAVFTVGSVVIACPNVGLQGIIPLLHTVITSGSNEKKPRRLAAMSGVSFKDSAPSLYVQSWATMAKVCLADDKLAKRYIPLFVQELERSNLPELRNNIMVAMADFCVRYTALVDGYIARITKSLRDPCEVVRRHTFILLSRLLQRDYVKWRGVLFLRFLLSLVDDSGQIRHLADYLFCNILKAKAPLLAYNSFIEAIYVLNGHQQGQSASDPANDLFAIRGMDEISRNKRMHIYVSLLKQMAPEHLLATSAKLCAEILAATCDGLLNIDNATGQAVLQNALQILACKEMRIQSTSASETEMDEEPVTDNSSTATSAAAQAIKGRVITQVAKKNLIQIAIPIFIELKRLLESRNSPLTGCLMDCLKSLLKDYKNEIDEILVADKQLQKELLYDMNRQEDKGKDKAGTSKDEVMKAKSVVKTRYERTPVGSRSIPKVNGVETGRSSGSRPKDVLESVRRMETLDSDDGNGDE
ncbi:hypothetical protein LUZ60_015861 [Juncus effusus]|nr:hypothetical protein LUZ60_015861 [Juncus effusus]